jgi:hypothetical protein
MTTIAWSTQYLANASYLIYVPPWALMMRIFGYDGKHPNKSLCEMSGSHILMEYSRGSGYDATVCAEDIKNIWVEYPGTSSYSIHFYICDICYE